MNCYYQKLRTAVEQELAQFRKDMLMNDKEYIFDRAYEIRFYNEVTDYLTNETIEGNLDKVIFLILKKEGNILESLYDEFISDEYASIETYGGIEDFIHDIYLRESEME